MMTNNKDNKSRRRPNGKPSDDFIEKVIEIGRISRTVKGGRRIRFRALVVVGDGKGNVGVGTGKANDVSKAIAKANAYARRHQQQVSIINDSIPYESTGIFGSAHVFLKPAPKGTSVIAGGTVRAIIEAVGIKNVVAKSLGSANKLNIAKATMVALIYANKLNKKYEVKTREHKKKDVK